MTGIFEIVSKALFWTLGIIAGVLFILGWTSWAADQDMPWAGVSSVQEGGGGKSRWIRPASGSGWGTCPR